jgi:CBS domain-containing protein
MKNIENVKLHINSTIKQALEIIDKAAMQIALIVDENDKLLGTLTDGDIRRGLLKGLDLNSSIESIIFKTPTIAKKRYFKNCIIKKTSSNTNSR